MSWKEQWITTPVEPTKQMEFAKIPAGKYVCRISQAKIDETGSYGPKISFGLTIDNGEFVNRYLWVNLSLNDDRLSDTKSKIALLCDNSDNLEMVLESLIHKLVEVNVTYKMGKDKLGNPKEFQNTYINGLAKNDDVPF